MHFNYQAKIFKRKINKSILINLLPLSKNNKNKSNKNIKKLKTCLMILTFKFKLKFKNKNHKKVNIQKVISLLILVAKIQDNNNYPRDRKI